MSQMMELEFEASDTPWDSTRDGRKEFPDGVYECKGKEVKYLTNPESGKSRYQVEAEILSGEMKGEMLRPVIFADFSKAANRAKVMTAFEAVGVPRKNLTGRMKVNPDQAFVGKTFLVMVKNAPPGEMTEYKGKPTRPLPDVDFITAAQAKSLKDKPKMQAATQGGGSAAAHVTGQNGAVPDAATIAGAGQVEEYDDLFKNA